jgi:hypothetical protein
MRVVTHSNANKARSLFIQKLKRGKRNNSDKRKSGMISGDEKHSCGSTIKKIKIRIV